MAYRPFDSAWLFSTQLWYFQPQGPFLGPRIPNLDPGWARDLFRLKMGPEKTRVCGRNGPHEVLWGSVRGDWIVSCPGGLWAGPFPPKPYQKNILRGFPISRKNPWPPWAPGGSPIGPLKELLPILPPAALHMVTSADQWGFRGIARR